MAKRTFSNKFISLADLYLAYRKAKAEAFYDRMHPSALAFAEFEQNLRFNLESLYKKLISNGDTWKDDLPFLGSHLYVPKSVDQSRWATTQDVHFIDVDPIANWKRRFEQSKNKRLDAKLRLIIKPSVAYHIISALWIIKVGEKFERKLDHSLSFGNRLRRKNEHFNMLFGGECGELNLDSLGLFSPYFSAYQKWRANGLKAMKNSVAANKKVTAITMDLAGFYHNVSPQFLLRPSFLKLLGVSLSLDERRFTQQLLDSINTWYESTEDFIDRSEGALPVGLSASRVISNVLLYQLDVEIRDSLKPIYYGRYVDDLFLVINTPDDVNSGRDILKHLSAQIPCMTVKYISGSEPDLRLSFGYAKDSNLFFTATKQKIFYLSSKHGLDLVDQISSQIREQSSEYRLLPDLPDNAADMAVGSLLASSNASLSADALRKADSVSMRRMGFALLLKDVESYSRDLKRDEWKVVREEFYSLVIRYLLDPAALFDLFGYYPRVFKLIIGNEDLDFAGDFVTKLFDSLELLQETTRNDTKSLRKMYLCKEYFVRALLQAIIQASTTKRFSKWRELGRLIRQLFSVSGVHLQKNYAPFLKDQSFKLLMADLGSRPYKDYWYYSQDQNIRDARIPRNKEIQEVISWLKIKEFSKAAELKTPHWPALSFPTRPLTIQEIGLITPQVFDDNSLFRNAIRGLRGAKVWSGELLGSSEHDGEKYFHVPANGKKKIRIALTNFKTTNKQWLAAVAGKQDRSKARYENINGLINAVLKEKKRPDYILFPECSLPRRWAISIAGRLASEGISMLAGLEYFPHRRAGNKLRNETLVSLATFWPGYKSNIIYLQPKLQPSHGEKDKLQKLGKQQFLPKGGIDSIPIYYHGNYIFGVVNCSDLTNPLNRMKYQGKVDGLYVLEWNPDVKTFSYLVEGAAHDVHTFVIQVNNRQFGDSRIRVPYRVDYKRDPLRLKGGISDFYVLGDMDYLSLRKFQKKNKMADSESEFKPVPIGFEISSYRKKV